MRQRNALYLAPALAELEESNEELKNAGQNAAQKEEELRQAELDHQNADISLNRAAAKAEQSARFAHKLAYSVASRDKQTVSGDDFTEYADAILSLSGKSTKQAEEEASILGYLASRAAPVPALIGGKVLAAFGGESSEKDWSERTNQIVALNEDNPGQLAFSIEGEADIFKRSMVSDSWKYRKQRHGHTCRMSAKDMLVTDDPERAVAETSMNDLIIVGKAAVDAALEKGRARGSSTYVDAVKFLIHRAINKDAAKNDVDSDSLIAQYYDTLKYKIEERSLGKYASALNPVLPAVLHPKIFELNKSQDAMTQRGDTIANALVGNERFLIRGESGILDNIQHSDEFGYAFNLEILDPLGRLLGYYGRVLGDPTGIRMSEEQFTALTKAYAEVRLKDILFNGGKFAKYGKEARIFKGIIDSDGSTARSDFLLDKQSNVVY